MRPPALPRRALALLVLAACTGAIGAPYAIDPTHTFVTMEIVPFGIATQRLRFDRSSGSVDFDPAAMRGAVDVTIDTASISSGIAWLDDRLRGADFFDVERHPQARFVADRLQLAEGRVGAVPGHLTLLGRSVAVTLTATRFGCYFNPVLRREACGGDFEAVIRRSDWGLTWGLGLGVPDEVRLLVQVEAVRQ